jgi:hypothetical protein
MLHEHEKKKDYLLDKVISGRELLQSLLHDSSCQKYYMCPTEHHICNEGLGFHTILIYKTTDLYDDLCAILSDEKIEYGDLKNKINNKMKEIFIIRGIVDLYLHYHSEKMSAEEMKKLAGLRRSIVGLNKLFLDTL